MVVARCVVLVVANVEIEVVLTCIDVVFVKVIVVVAVTVVVGKKTLRIVVT